MSREYEKIVKVESIITAPLGAHFYTGFEEPVETEVSAINTDPVAVRDPAYRNTGNYGLKLVYTPTAGDEYMFARIISGAIIGRRIKVVGFLRPRKNCDKIWLAFRGSVKGAGYIAGIRHDRVTKTFEYMVDEEGEVEGDWVTFAEDVGFVSTGYWTRVEFGFNALTGKYVYANIAGFHYDLSAYSIKTGLVLTPNIGNIIIGTLLTVATGESLLYADDILVSEF